MTKSVNALIATLGATLGLAGAATNANAHYVRAGCNCGPIAPTSYYKTVHPAKFATRYHDVSVYHHVYRVHRVVDVTRVQPIIHIHIVTRVHHHTIVQTSNSYQRVMESLAPIRYVTRSTENYYDCRCAR